MKLAKNKKIIILGVVFLFFVSFLLYNSALAFDRSASEWLDSIAGEPGVDLRNSDSAPVFIGKIINGFLAFLGVICMIYIMYAGLRLVTAGGNEESVAEARATIKWALIGLIVVMGAYALSYYVVSEVLDSAHKAPPTPTIDEIDDDGGLLPDICDGIECWAYNNNEAGCLGVYDEGWACCTWDSIDYLCRNLY